MSAQPVALRVSSPDTFIYQESLLELPRGGFLNKNMFKAIAIDVARRVLSGVSSQDRADFLAKEWPMPDRWLQLHARKEVVEARASVVASVEGAPGLDLETDLSELDASLTKVARFCGPRLRSRILRCVHEFETPPKPDAPVGYTTYHIEEMGDRRVFEDFSRSVEFASGQLVVVCDGHKDNQCLARQATEMFCTQFLKAVEGREREPVWEELLGEVYRITHSQIERFIQPHWQAFQEEVLQREDLPKVVGGTTLTATLMTKSGKLVCLCLGDSPAWIVRSTSAGFRCLPLSLIRTFASPKEYKILSKLADQGCLAPVTKEAMDQFPEQIGDCPYVEYEEGGYGNVSRSLGDYILRELTQGELPLTSAKVSAYEGLRKGDFIITGSDGINLSSAEIERACDRVSEKGLREDVGAFVEELRALSLSKPRHFLSDKVIERLPALSYFECDQKPWAVECAKVMISWDEDELLEALEDYMGAYLPQKNFAETEQWLDHCTQSLCTGLSSPRIQAIIEALAEGLEIKPPSSEEEVAVMMRLLAKHESGADMLSLYEGSPFCYPETSKTWKRDLQGQLIRFIEEGCHRDNLTLWVSRVH